MKECDQSSCEWTEATAMAAPALLGAAAGVIVSDLLDRDAKKVASIALGALGILTLVPFLTSRIVRKVNSPSTERGARRRIDAIRSAGSDVDAELEEQGII